MKVLLVEDQKRIAGFVCAGLKERGFVVDHCDNGDTGFVRASEGNYDVIVLDIMLPGRDGLSILKALRKARNATPVILLTARNELDDRIEGLSLGADDYLGKPFFVEELIARIQAVFAPGFRRTSERASGWRLAPRPHFSGSHMVRPNRRSHRPRIQPYRIPHAFSGTGVHPHGDPRTRLGLRFRPQHQYRRRLYSADSKENCFDRGHRRRRIPY